MPHRLTYRDIKETSVESDSLLIQYNKLPEIEALAKIPILFHLSFYNSTNTTFFPSANYREIGSAENGKKDISTSA